MRRLAIIVLLALAVPGGATGAASGGSVSASHRFHGSYVVIRSVFHIWDRGYCVTAEDGSYNNPACYDYDRNDARLDLRVWKDTRQGWRLVHTELMQGHSGAAKASLLFEGDLGLPKTCRRQSLWWFKYKVRLFDPVTNAVVTQTRQREFVIGCR
jgi:hypothetical protein